MKKVLSLVLAVTMALFMGACNVNGGNNEKDSQTPVKTTASNSANEGTTNKEEKLSESTSAEEDFVATRVPAGQLYSLAEAYELGMLSKKDIMHISYFYTGSLYGVYDVFEWTGDESKANRSPAFGNYSKEYEEFKKVDFVPEIPEPVLTEEIENYLIKTIYNLKKDYIIQCKLDNIKLCIEYGYPIDDAWTGTGTEKDISVLSYVGEYHGYKIARFSDRYSDYPCCEASEMVAGINITYGQPPFFMVIT